MSGLSRLFIVDPMCVLNYGHNPQSLIYFSDYFERRGFTCYPVSCRYFKSSDKKYANFITHFGYYYEEFIPLPPHIDISADLEQYVETLCKEAAFVSESDLTNDPLTNQAILDWKILFDTYEVSESDYILYPSCDYYGLVGLLYYLRHLPEGKAPKIHLRFIGVMENARLGGGDSLRIIRALLQGLTRIISISAEAPVYSAYLSHRLRMPVSTTLYPLHHDLIEIKKAPDNPFVVFSAGAGREDKGFFQLRNIVSRYAVKFPNDNVRFVIQNLRPLDELNNVAYTSQLYACPNVELIAAIQSDNDMFTNYADSDLSIMPYDFETYRLRGSAVFMESIMYGRSFAISAKTGFEPLMPLFPSGNTAMTDSDFCQIIHETYLMSADERMHLSRQSREAYNNYACTALDKVFM